ncbi:phosphate ABC transporter permease subunit PstC [Helicobacter kayseriensis]|uniref:phosphate ABC transporter permease subunit PstC n=1 Tax=Helicobacter kayseriensis TaxID=2905877 RepID=UPI001E5F7446|nr:phosphate ABC transporter permease subunit PstC [Helicobacter kayseriensis]MCE3046563.1 phosphate ABC transporter permease subunit PstC [Helicobacter kayseriensis]MCE3048135.1 phosphate ABC transporter permease subunit PstC [Helicobacter kayseriensis]
MKERFIKSTLFLCALISIVVSLAIMLTILIEAIKFFQKESLFTFLFSSQWAADGAFLKADGSTGHGIFGAVSLFWGTFYISLIAMLTAIPVGVMCAIYLGVFAGKKSKNLFKPILEVIAGIPTVVFGFFAVIVIAPLIVGFFEIFNISASYESALGAGFIMGVMIVPIVASLSQDCIESVSAKRVNGAYALGMTKKEVVFAVILPEAMPGIIASCLLGLSRALGETMIVIMAASLRPNLSLNFLEDMTTVTVHIVQALQGDQAFDSSLALSAFSLGLALFIITLVINMISVYLIHQFHKGKNL